jgi:hypothetical protein
MMELPMDSLLMLPDGATYSQGDGGLRISAGYDKHTRRVTIRAETGKRKMISSTANIASARKKDTANIYSDRREASEGHHKGYYIWALVIAAIIIIMACREVYGILKNKF